MSHYITEIHQLKDIIRKTNIGITEQDLNILSQELFPHIEYTRSKSYQKGFKQGDFDAGVNRDVEIKMLDKLVDEKSNLIEIMAKEINEEITKTELLIYTFAKNNDYEEYVEKWGKKKFSDKDYTLENMVKDILSSIEKREENHPFGHMTLDDWMR